MPDSTHLRERRKSHRLRTNQRIVLVAPSFETTLQAEAVDLSKSGLRALLDRDSPELPTNERLLARVGGRSVFSTVRWSMGRLVGLSFQDELGSEDVERLRVTPESSEDAELQDGLATVSTRTFLGSDGIALHAAVFDRHEYGYRGRLDEDLSSLLGVQRGRVLAGADYTALLSQASEMNRISDGWLSGLLASARVQRKVRREDSGAPGSELLSDALLALCDPHLGAASRTLLEALGPTKRPLGFSLGECQTTLAVAAALAGRRSSHRAMSFLAQVADSDLPVAQSPKLLGISFRDLVQHMTATCLAMTELSSVHHLQGGHLVLAVETAIAGGTLTIVLATSGSIASVIDSLLNSRPSGGDSNQKQE